MKRTVRKITIEWESECLPEWLGVVSDGRSLLFEIKKAVDENTWPELVEAEKTKLMQEFTWAKKDPAYATYMAQRTVNISYYVI